MHYFSNRAQIALVALVFFFGPIQGNNWEPCGDWIAYNDEKCFKIIDDTLRTYDEAKNACATQEHTSTLAVIRSSEEQQFLSDYLFKTEQKVENFWIGAKYSSQNGSFVWIDNSLLNYTNWDAGHSPQSRANHCVHMQADEPVVGKWRSGRCVKKNALVCQRMQFWSTEFLQKKFLDSRKQQRDVFDIIWNLTQSLASANQRIESLENVNKRSDEPRQQRDVFDTIRNLTQSLASANEKILSQKESLQNSHQRIDTLKQNLENFNQRINEQKQTFETAISNANAKINEQKQNFIPIGFLYTQLHLEKSPADIWPWMTWTDVSSAYAGVFFRVEGGGSRQFGQVQDENTWRMFNIQTGNSRCIKNLPKNASTFINEWSQPVYSGGFSGGENCFNFEMFDGEIRPKNVAIRVWRRTA